ncbi:gamma-glutamyl-gamma-aminobutyrate hydrolase family protein [Paraliobacillus sediminis]|uniref:gamma-glutamyl-gamma-aminobutyrate hydrolase family protein n=1 Tax=Paraliobacillus sediminis TaxID=1885916 RepID=UPI000E3E622B|nr:gamma-glutamyl-gamma-aminobutyrate hydrolase family protein [Paraliobacillus sediminis]
MKQSLKPVIGITSSNVTHNKLPSINLHEKYIQAIVTAGGVPVVIPTGPKDMAEVWVSICNGIILSSGEDVDPYSYHANPEPKLQQTNLKRDLMEIDLVKSAQQQNKPLLGICRGITMLNAALGGTVIQDIETANSKAIKHYQQSDREDPTHDVQIKEGSLLYKILNDTKIRVNSMHHQSINKLAPNLITVATALDGVIEAVEGPSDAPFMLGVQWHPEEMAHVDSRMQDLFQVFVHACSKVENINFSKSP